MLGETHVLVANISLACLSQEERHILLPRWGGLESGATLSDEFRIMWEPVTAGSKQKQLVHRCYVDSDFEKDHGCVTRAVDHANGSISFIKDYLKGDLDDAYNEVEFLENLGMFLGIASHHIADLCTPIHVGHKIDFKSLGYPTLSRFHSKTERDILRNHRQLRTKLAKPKMVDLTTEYFWDIARYTYENHFLKLEGIYRKGNTESILDMSSEIVSNAIRHTVNVWHTIMAKTGMTKQKWSMQPLP